MARVLARFTICTDTRFAFEKKAHLGKVSEHPLLFTHRLGEEVKRKALDLRDPGYRKFSSDRATLGARNPETEALTSKNMYLCSMKSLANKHRFWQ